VPMPVLPHKPETIKGFAQVAVYQRQESAEEKRTLTRRYVFSDGVATVSVFVQPKSVAGPLPSDQVNRRGALSMLSRQIQDSWVTVMGEIPPETLKQFTQSIEWKATP
jgi:sigma-E factor negative regulatory protein RseB